MFEKLKAYLDATTSDGLADTILGCCKALFEAGVDEHLYLLDVELDLAVEREFDVVYNGIINVVQPLVEQTLRELGVRTMPETPLHYLRDMLENMRLMTQWEDRNSISAYCEGNEDNIETLADVMALMGRYTAEDYIQYLEHVSDELIANLGELVRDDNPPYDLPPPPVVAAVKARLHHLVVNTQNTDGLFLRALNSGMRLGMPFERLLAPWRAEISKQNGRRYGHDLVLFAAASDLPNDKIREAVQNEREHYPGEVTDLLEVDSAINELMRSIANA